MAVGINFAVKSSSERETEEIARVIGRNLKGGEVLELVGDIGAGKTTFVRGLARGMGHRDNVSSPSFTISRVYDSGKLHLKHFDFYRLAEAGILEYDLDETVKDPSSVTVIEWSNIVEDVLPKSKIVIEFKVGGQSSRHLRLTCPDNLEYLIKGLKEK
ncbi:MAG TPA: tRNA (adenosine(37)-N6)-threonylcarbamoyltransferase complex ATPase subunit type 1 TsaE [Candidatus Saccharimonadales bacterium]|jgi:tRNA threonylcarbamoyladenosine biosynthesis protein TsaE|nr:tRNA (adenosine(37)-N6)-threonylcarbamoyltransferase complex ATPase subunit type 1 TsaE [Candidatus Saccharimonadales bacterium]